MTAKPKTKRVLRLKIKRDKHGRYVVVRGRKYRIANTVTKAKLAKFVLSKLGVSGIKQARVPKAKATPNSGLLGPLINPPVYQEPLAKQRLERQELEATLKDRQKLAEFEQEQRNVAEAQQKAKVKKHASRRGKPRPKPKPKRPKVPDFEREIRDGSRNYLKALYMDIWGLPIPSSVSTEELREAILTRGDPHNPAPFLLPYGSEPSTPLSGPETDSEDEKYPEARESDTEEPVPAPQPEEPAEEPNYQGGRRTDRMDEKLGMSNHQIDKVLEMYPEYLGCISHNEFTRRVLPHVRPKSRGGCVINTDPASKPGCHWQALFWDARPEGSASIEFYDSFADPIDKVLRRNVRDLAAKLDAGTYLKLKENTIKQQSDKTSNCGLFATKFLIDRFRGKPFKEASGYDDSVRGEGQIRKFRKQVGFGYVASFSDQHGGYDLFYTDQLPPSVRKYLKGPEIPIRSIFVVRTPIQSGLNTAINILSLGKWNSAKRELGYDKLFHLYMIINGTIKLERNHVVEMSPGKIDSSNRDEQSVPVSLLGKSLTVKDLLNNTIKRVGIADLNRYDPSSNNCQDFMLQVLDSNGLGGNPHVRSFIKQDAKSVVSKLPSFTQYLMKGVTDVAHAGTKVVDAAKTALVGEGRTKRGGYIPPHIDEYGRATPDYRGRWPGGTTIPTISYQFE